MKRTPLTTIMSADLTTIQRGRSISEAYETFKHAPFQHLPVCDGHSPVGVLSDGNIHSVTVLEQGGGVVGNVTTTDHVQLPLERFR
jgi:CBS-domain-containing membrane protein